MDALEYLKYYLQYKHLKDKMIIVINLLKDNFIKNFMNVIKIKIYNRKKYLNK